MALALGRLGLATLFLGATTRLVLLVLDPALGLLFGERSLRRLGVLSGLVAGFQRSALDIGALAPHLDAHGLAGARGSGAARSGSATTAGNRLPQLADGLALQRHLARLGSRRRICLAVTLTQEIQQIAFLVVGDGVIAAGLVDTGLAQLAQQPVQRNTHIRSELGDSNFSHTRPRKLIAALRPRRTKAHERS